MYKRQDYYHIGLVVSVRPLKIINATPPAVRISERSVCMEAFGKCGQGWFIRLFNNNAEKHCANIEICGKCARAELKAFEVKTFLFDGERIAESGIVV